MTTREDSLGRELPQRMPTVKVGKVMVSHPESHAVDVVLLDGSFATHVPVLSGTLGTTHGVAHVPGPSYDKEVFVRKTYPHAHGDVVQPVSNPSGVGRDQYAVLLQLDGPGTGRSGLVVLGFLAAQVSEMLFAKDELDETGQVVEPDKFADLLLARHPSDVQITVDKAGTVSIQHPTGSRLTIGTGGVDLTKKDYDHLYELRHNTTNWHDVEAVATGPGVDGHGEDQAHLLLQVDGKADLYGKNLVRIHTKSTTFITLNEEAREIDVYAQHRIVIHNQAGSTVEVVGSDITITAPGNITVTAGGAVDVHGALILLNS